MSSCNKVNQTMGQRLFSYLEKYPKNYDVTFSVGPEKTLVKALKIILKSSSPVLEKEFEDCWEQAVVKEGEGIPLPDFDPIAFRLFIKLVIMDTWSEDALKELKLPSSQLLHLMSICRKYEITAAVQSLMVLVKEFLQNIQTYVKTDDFLLLSQPQLETILASDELPIDEPEIYDHACGWAKEQCKKRNLGETGENMRQVLGDCLYQIRFPSMSTCEFATATQIQGLLSLEEIVKIFQFIGLNEKYSLSNNTTELNFKTEKRKVNPFTSVPKGCSTISLTQVFPVTDDPYTCDGSETYYWFNTNMKITLVGLGFLGPIDADSFYDVTVKIQTSCPGGWRDNTKKMEKRIFAPKSKTFYFIFDQPIVLNTIPHDGWKSYYRFLCTLKGPNTRSLQITDETKEISDKNQEFVVLVKWFNPQLVEILYNTF